LGQGINFGRDYFELLFFVAAAGAAAGNVEGVELCTGSITGLFNFILDDDIHRLMLDLRLFLNLLRPLYINALRLGRLLYV
jgi:hypothetical protein